MIKVFRVSAILLILFLASFLLLYSPFIFQEGNPLPVAYGIIKLSTTKDMFVKIGENKYIVKSNDEDLKKLTDYLAQNGLLNTDRGGAALFFKDKRGKSYTATARRYTHNFEILDFSNQQGLILP